MFINKAKTVSSLVYFHTTRQKLLRQVVLLAFNSEKIADSPIVLSKRLKMQYSPNALGVLLSNLWGF